MSTQTTNLGLTKDDPADFYNIERVNQNLDKIDAAVGDGSEMKTAGGTGTAITLSIPSITDYRANQKFTFIASANNAGNATTIKVNSLVAKPLYKPNTTTAPNLVAGKAYEVWYDSSNDCFFLKASAEGNAIAANVLAGKTFSNDDDSGITGTMVNNGSVGTVNLTNEGSEYLIPQGYHNGLGKVKAVITGLIASVIKAGTTVGGILGTFTSDATAAAGEILSGKTAYVNGSKITGEMPIRTGTWTVTNSEINGNYLRLPIKYDGYHTTADKLQVLDNDWIPENIKSGVDLFGKVGVMTPLQSPIKYITPINTGVSSNAVPVPEGLSAYTGSYTIGIYNLSGTLIRTITHTYPNHRHHYDKYADALIIYSWANYNTCKIYDMYGTLLYSSSALTPNSSTYTKGIGRSKNRYYVFYYYSSNYYVRVYDLNWTLLRTINPSGGDSNPCFMVGFDDGIAINHPSNNGGLWYFNEINTAHARCDFANVFGV